MSKNEIPDGPPIWFVAVIFIVSILVSLGFVGVLIWAIVSLVNWLISQ